jgi:hypothetical protein
MKYAVQMSSGAITYIPSFIKIGLGIHKLKGGNLMSLLIFFQNKERGLIPLIFPNDGKYAEIVFQERWECLNLRLPNVAE